MAGQSRTLKLSILGDVDQLKKSLNTGSTEVQGFGNKLGDFSKKAGLAFAAAGAAAAAYAGKLLIDGVKSAIEDEAAQAKLATTLENVTGATKAQIAAVEDYITQTALANGVTDDQLRPSLDRLVRSTKDVEEAQKLQTLALDIASGTGKDLQTVSEALGKAYDGNLGALKKLGVGIDDSIIKSKNFDAAAAALSKTFEGQASKQAETFQGKMARLTVAFDEAKETVGSYVLDALTPLVSNFVDKGIPAIQDFAGNLSKTLGPAFTEILKVVRDDVLPIIKSWYEFIADTIVPAFSAVIGPAFQGLVSAFTKIKNAVVDNSDELKPLLSLFKSIANFIKEDLAPILGGAFKLALSAIGTIVAGLVTGFSKLVGFITSTVNKIREFVNFVKDNPVTRFFFGGSNTTGANFQQSGFTQNPSTGFIYYEDDPAEDPEDRDKRIADLKKAFAVANPFVTPGPTGAPLVVTSKGLGTRDISGLSAQQQAAVLRSLELQAETERLRQARAGAQTPTAPTITLNVTGSIDPERTAREIVNTLNDSFYRGTNGALNLVGAS
jgi:hypothetical protein